MDYETSAGGVVATRKNSDWYVLLIKDKSNNWTFPKGEIESGEDKQKTAAREVSEEAGLSDFSLVAKLPPISYYYTFSGKPRKKTVDYYLYFCKTTEKPVPQLNEGITEATWFTLDKAKQMIGYPKTNSVLLEEVEKKLNQLLQD